MSAVSVRREGGAASPWLFVAIGLLVIGAIVAVLGVRSAVVALQDRQELADYARARTAASEAVESGNNTVAVGQELCNCDVQTRDLGRQQVDALAVGDVERYNGLVDQVNAIVAQANQLLDQLRSTP
jgi:hypothetical protein